VDRQPLVLLLELGVIMEEGYTNMKNDKLGDNKTNPKERYWGTS
jgi:hypothetical protein